MKKIYYANISQKETEVAILVSDKLDFRTKEIIKDIEWHFIII